VDGHHAGGRRVVELHRQRAFRSHDAAPPARRHGCCDRHRSLRAEAASAASENDGTGRRTACLANRRRVLQNVPQEVHMRGVVLFVAGVFVGLTVHVAMAQSGGGAGVEMMNHVGINVPNVAEAVAYYTEKMGYREAFRANDSNGQPRLVYMQISKNTFLELQPAAAQRPAGFTHYGLVVSTAVDAVSAFKKRGLTVTDTSKSDTGVILANITDPYMGRVELVEITPNSMHNKAIQRWK
jgi:catechol 2,3-dioxygenase-like lactoylglutathione lyase family enzyme